jgi:hypothetical protein
VNPAAIQLSRSYDVLGLQDDLSRVSDAAWKAMRPGSEAGGPPAIPAGWTCVPLRSPGGDDRRTDPGGPGLQPFAATRYLSYAPYLRTVLDGLPAELRSARLLCLHPGASVEAHRDPHTGFAHGQVRLHIPITTNGNAVIEIDSEPHTWLPGSLWTGDFTRPHRLWNHGPSSRVHLVIDALTSPELLDLVPAEVAAGLDRSSIIINSPRLDLKPGQLAELTTRLAVPGQAAHGSRPPDDRVASGSIQLTGGGLVLALNDEPLYGLVPISPTSFRFEGWTDARTLHVERDAVRVVSRQGGKVRQVSLKKT